MLFWGWGVGGEGWEVGGEGVGVGMNGTIAETTQTFTKILTLGLNTML